MSDAQSTRELLVAFCELAVSRELVVMNRFARLTPLVALACGGMAGCHSQPSGPIWNVPAVVGRPIDAVKKQLVGGQDGAASDATLKQSTWMRQGTTLSATWRPTNRRVTEWTLIARDEAHAVREEERDQLLKIGQLQDNNPAYSLDWIEANDRPLFYTGVRVTPALKNHAVTLRLSGSSALVQVSYSVTGTVPKNEETITVPPWQEDLTLPDDSQITLTAVLYKTLDGAASSMKVDILSDGKVVGTASTTGGSVRCRAEL